MSDNKQFTLRKAVLNPQQRTELKECRLTNNEDLVFTVRAFYFNFTRGIDSKQIFKKLYWVLQFHYKQGN